MNDIIIKKLDEVYFTVDGEPHVRQELMQHFEFFVPGYQFMPAYRNRFWDGKIRIYNQRDRTIYSGLLHHIEKFAQDRDYTIEYDSAIKPAVSFSIQEAIDFTKTLNLPFAPRDYQIKAFVYSVRNRRSLLVCPTASGKSLIIYMLLRYYHDKRSLIIVPTTSLVSQLYGDFAEYGKQEGWRSEDHVQYIMAGRTKDITAPITISTWQSMAKQPKDYFDQFDVIIGDEAHLFKAKSLTGIMTKLTSTEYRFGLTGTLDDAMTHHLVLEGLFGRRKNIITTKKLIDDKHLAKLEIKAITLKYTQEECKQVASGKYQDEIEFLIGHRRRNAFIQNLALSMKGNTLVLFQYVEKHGNVLKKLIEDKAKDGRKVFYVYGGTDVDLREDVRRITETETDAIIVASSGVYSTGVNIKNLHNIIFTHPGKSKIRVLQSIGRALRKTDSKTNAILYDIVDDLSYKSKQNFAVKHFIERHKYYTAEKFPMKIYKVEL